MIPQRLTDAVADWLTHERVMKGGTHTISAISMTCSAGSISRRPSGRAADQGRRARLTTRDMRAGWRMSAAWTGSAFASRIVGHQALPPSQIARIDRWPSVACAHFSRCRAPLRRRCARDDGSCHSTGNPGSRRAMRRDRALYGCGLRISERWAFSVRRALPEVLRITGRAGGKADADPARRARNDRGYRRLCPALTADEPLFRGARGSALNPRLVQKAVEQLRHQLGLPATATPMPFAIPSRRICSAGGDLRTIRNCSAMPRFPRHRPIQRSIPQSSGYL